MVARRGSDARATDAYPSAREWAQLYYRSARRSIRRYGVAPLRMFRALDARPVFVVGSPRSGTSFTAQTLGRVTGFADLGELRPLKRVIPVLYTQPVEQAAPVISTVLGRAQRFGLVAGLRPIEQTPESTFLIRAVAAAYPDACFVHLVRDGRDVAASLIALGWLRGEPAEHADEVGHAFGQHTRFWVEPERGAEFAGASEATRAAWVWRRYESTARESLRDLGGRSIEIRYEHLVEDPDGTAHALATFLRAEERVGEFVGGFAHTVAAARGRWRADLGDEQLADVQGEAGGLLRELGYIG